MSKFQPINFKDIEDMLAYLPEHEYEITMILREMVYEFIPGVKEKLSYNVPFFSKHYQICFIWPASVPWGNVPAEGVQLGFTNGHLLSDEENYLESQSRKKVRTHTFYEISDINQDLIASYLQEAAIIDKEQ